MLYLLTRQFVLGPYIVSHTSLDYLLDAGDIRN